MGCSEVTIFLTQYFQRTLDLQLFTMVNILMWLVSTVQYVTSADRWLLIKTNQKMFAKCEGWVERGQEPLPSILDPAKESGLEPEPSKNNLGQMYITLCMFGCRNLCTHKRKGVRSGECSEPQTLVVWFQARGQQTRLCATVGGERIHALSPLDDWSSSWARSSVRSLHWQCPLATPKFCMLLSHYARLQHFNSAAYIWRNLTP